MRQLTQLSNASVNESIYLSLFVLSLAQNKKITTMKLLKVKIRVLAAWNNHRG